MVSPLKLDMPLDDGVADYVDVLRKAGIETIQSCEGGAGHACPDPVITFTGAYSEGYRAVSIAIEAGLPVLFLRRVWHIDGHEYIEKTSTHQSQEIIRKMHPPSEDFKAGAQWQAERGWVPTSVKPESEYDEPEGTRAVMYGYENSNPPIYRYGFGLWEPAVEGRHNGRFYGLHANTHFRPTHINVLRNDQPPTKEPSNG